MELPLPGRRCGFWVKTPVKPNDPRPSSVAKVGAKISWKSNPTLVVCLPWTMERLSEKL